MSTINGSAGSRSSAALRMSWSRKYRFSGTAHTLSASRKSAVIANERPVYPEDFIYSEPKPTDITITTTTTVQSIDEDDDLTPPSPAQTYERPSGTFGTSQAAIDLERQWDMELERHQRQVGGRRESYLTGDSGSSRNKSEMSLEQLG